MTSDHTCALGIIAGTGVFPRIVMEQCRKKGRPFFVLAFYDFTDPELVKPSVEHAWLNIGEIGRAMHLLEEQGVREIVMVGSGRFPRPSLGALITDKMGRKLLGRIGFRWPGDNAILTCVAEFLEEHGITIVSPQDVVGGLLGKAGPLGAKIPQEREEDDIRKGTNVLEGLSPWDFGQGIALQNGLVLGVEAAEGTDACIRRCGALKRTHAHDGAPVYVKRAKVGQSQALDLPAVGPQTVYALHEAGFSGLAFEAERTLVLLEDETRRLADNFDIFLVGT